MKYLSMIAFVLLTFPCSLFAETVESDNFVLTDASGNMRGQITYSSEGTPSLFLYDTHNVPRVWIGLYPDGAPGVVLNDEKGLAGAIMRLVSSNGDPVVVLKEDGQDKVIIDTKGRVALSGGNTGFNTSITIIMTAIIGMIAGAIGGTVASHSRKRVIEPSL